MSEGGSDPPSCRYIQPCPHPLIGAVHEQTPAGTPKEGLFFPPPLDRSIENIIQVKNDSKKVWPFHPPFKAHSLRCRWHMSGRWDRPGVVTLVSVLLGCGSLTHGLCQRHISGALPRLGWGVFAFCTPIQQDVKHSLLCISSPPACLLQAAPPLVNLLVIILVIDTSVTP